MFKIRILIFCSFYGGTIIHSIKLFYIITENKITLQPIGGLFFKLSQRDEFLENFTEWYISLVIEIITSFNEKYANWIYEQIDKWIYQLSKCFPSISLKDLSEFLNFFINWFLMNCSRTETRRGSMEVYPPPPRPY
jgi:hypothetical protein